MSTRLLITCIISVLALAVTFVVVVPIAASADPSSAAYWSFRHTYETVRLTITRLKPGYADCMSGDIHMKHGTTIPGLTCYDGEFVPRPEN